jgi:hypothetical protein
MSLDYDLPEEPDPHKLMFANLVWDLIDHKQVPEAMELLNMVPPGPDGRVMACEDSHIRMVLAAPVGAQIEYLAAKISHIALTVMLRGAAVDIEKDLLEELISQNEEFLGAGARVIVAHLIAAGLLTYTR